MYDREQAHCVWQRTAIIGLPMANQPPIMWQLPPIGDVNLPMNRLSCQLAAIAALTVGATMVFPQAMLLAVEKRAPAKRARPPKWPAEVVDTFFPDARDALVGPRPDYAARAAAVTKADTTAAGGSPGGSESTKVAWSKVIDADTIETEIKRLAQAVAQDVATPSDFKGGKFEDCRRHFTTLAMLFAVAAEYDGTVRWQDASAGLRDLFARAGHNCKVGTDATFRESTERKQDLADLVAGARPQLPPAERTAEWAQVADRPPLMQRLEIAHEEGLTKWLANEREFSQHRDEVRHEAQLVALIADVMSREGFEFWDDDQYAACARELKQAATIVATSAEQNDFAKVRAAASRMTKACADCHEGYRG